MSVFVNRHGAGRVRLAGGVGLARVGRGAGGLVAEDWGKPGWAVTWLGLAGAQIGRGGSWHVGRRLAGEALIERPASSKGG